MSIPCASPALLLRSVPRKAGKKDPEEILRARIKAVPRGQQGRVAELAGVGAAVFSRWRKGERINAQLDTLKRLADALGLPFTDLFREPDQQLPPAAPLPDHPRPTENARIARALKKLDEVRSILAEPAASSRDQREDTEGRLAAKVEAGRKARTRPRSEGATG